MAAARPARRGVRRARGARVLRGLAVAGVIALLAAVLAELLLFALEPLLFRDSFFVYDAELGFRARAVPGRTNRFGFNDRDYPLARPPGTVRVLVVGDSFGWAGGRDDNYTEHLERRLAERFGAGAVEVINTGYPGTHTGEQLAMLRAYGLRYRGVDLALLGFFSGNDLIEADPARRRIVFGGAFLDLEGARERVLFGRPVVAASRLLSLGRARLRVLREGLRGAEPAPDAPEVSPPQPDKEKTRSPSAPPAGRAGAARSRAPGGPVRVPPPAPGEPATFSEAAFLDIEHGRLKLCERSRLERGRYDAHLELVRRSLLEMRALLRERGAELVVALFPDEFQVDAGLLERVVALRGGPGRDAYEVDCAHRIVREWLAPAGIPVVDLLPALRAESRERRLYLLRDTHWNQAGRELAAGVLLRALEPRIAALRERARRREADLAAPSRAPAAMP